MMVAKKIAPDRQALADAIGVRDEARTARDEAYQRLVETMGEQINSYSREMTGEKHRAARLAVIEARDKLESLEAEHARLVAGGSDKVDIHKRFIQAHDGYADDVIGSAREALEVAEKTYAGLDVRKVKLEAELRGTEDRLEKAEKTINDEVLRLLEAELPVMQSQLWEAAAKALERVGALNVVFKSCGYTLFRPQNPYRDASLVLNGFEHFYKCTSVLEDQQRFNACVRAGAAPLEAAIANLKTDPAAPLPTVGDS